MRKHARNYMRIYNQYNLPYLAKPGDDLFAAARLQQIQDLKDEHYKRIASGEDEDSVLQSLEQKMSELKVRNTFMLIKTLTVGSFSTVLCFTYVSLLRNPTFRAWCRSHTMMHWMRHQRWIGQRSASCSKQLRVHYWQHLGQARGMPVTRTSMSPIWWHRLLSPMDLAETEQCLHRRRQYSAASVANLSSSCGSCKELAPEPPNWLPE